jgi:transcriptional regulator with XRE-family HTH domain
MSGKSSKSGQHTIFSANLRHLCAMQTSIADVCRDTGINRQQFNKYMAGRAIPSARVLRKICQRLGVSEDALLSSPLKGANAQAAASALSAPARLPQLGRELDRLFNLFLPDLRDNGQLLNGDFGAGAYHVYFPFSGFSGYVLRSYQEVWWHKDLLMFTRLTRLKEMNTPEVMLFGRHFGVAIASKGEISLIARNRASPYQISVLNIQPELLFKRHFVGLSVTHGAGWPLACRVVLEKLSPARSRRENLRTCGVMPLDDASVPPFVQDALKNDAARGPTLQLPNLDEIVGARLIK